MNYVKNLGVQTEYFLSIFNIFLFAIFSIPTFNIFSSIIVIRLFFSFKHLYFYQKYYIPIINIHIPSTNIHIHASSFKLNIQYSASTPEQNVRYSMTCMSDKNKCKIRNKSKELLKVFDVLAILTYYILCK